MEETSSLQNPPTPSPRPLWPRLQALAPAALIALGAGLRLEGYIRNPSLRLDECLLSLNIVSRSYAGLWRPLENGQGAPPLFLMVERLAVSLAGRSEYGLRALPLVAGLLSLPLLWVLARRLVGKNAALLALALFAVSYEPVRFSREVKQYSVDLAVTLLLYVGLAPVLGRPLRWYHVALLGAVGVIAVFASHPAMFVLAGLALVYGLEAGRRREGRQLLAVGAVAAVWLAGVGVFYFLLGRQLHGSGRLADYWGAAFLPLLPHSVSDLHWYLDTFFGFLSNPGGFQYEAIAALPFFAGCVSLGQRDRHACWLLLTPLLLTLLASAARVYPFSDRLILFLLPALLIFIGEGAASFARHFGPRSAVTVFLVALLLAPVYLRVPGMITEPEMVRDARPLLQYYAEHRRPGDVLYVYRYAWAATTFYAPRFGLDPQGKDIVWGAESSYTDEFARVQELRKIAGRGRVWLLFSDEVPGWQGITDEKYLTRYLDTRAPRLDQQRRENAGLYLYDVTNLPPPP